ncbi:MAG: glycosyltransferase family 2 protein [Ginsengibacter sp.]
MLLSIYSILGLLYWAFLSAWLIINGSKILPLSSIPNPENKRVPSVVIIIAARNEEYALKQALVSVCTLDYSNYRVLVINDRSTDNSGHILKDLQAKYNNLSVMNINTLPQGWLGKNHALYMGFKCSDEEYMLFTDADVLYHKDVLSKAMGYCLKNNLDHLTILPGITSPSSILNGVILTFIIILTAVQRPWAAKIKSSKASMGVGAFNLVARQAYKKAGTHTVIAMRPDDDLKLGAYIKASGGAADVLYGQKELQVEWYASVKDLISGLMKNVFSGFDYNIFKAIGGALGILLFFVLPLPVILIFGNFAERIGATCIFLFQAILYWKMSGSNEKWWYAFMSIYAGLIITYIIIKSAIVTLYKGGIYWRDTFYSLAELRKNR